MKPIYWILIISSAILIPNTMMIILILWLKLSWWWIILPMGADVLGGIITGVIILILKLSKRKPIEQVIDPEDAEQRAIHLLKYDNDNPDNFIRTDRIIKKVGEPGKDRTPILWLIGKGSETNSKIDMIVNLNNPKKEILILFNRSDEFVLESIRTIAENPAEQEIEETETTFDSEGRPHTRKLFKKTSKAVLEKAEKEKEALESEAF